MAVTPIAAPRVQDREDAHVATGEAAAASLEEGRRS